MPRPKRHRKIGKPPGVKGFRPYGGRGSNDVVKMLYEEYEALKLADYDGYSQEEAAQRMEVSRPTFTRVYDRALKKVAKAFVEHREILLEGGTVSFDEDWFRCRSCNNVFKMPGKHGKISKCPVCGSEDIYDESEKLRQQGMNESWCVCVKCNHKVKHQKGIPCRKRKCPECEGQMVKENELT
ncbi:MAG TPA: DUF134 domain-containing protein [Bacteroidales bacterium]|nr:DUF134 domain-containing protein [Bacteroidales bacterium]